MVNYKCIESYFCYKNSFIHSSWKQMEILMLPLYGKYFVGCFLPLILFLVFILFYLVSAISIFAVPVTFVP